MAERPRQVLLGGSGMLGRALQPRLEARGELWTPRHREVDITDARAVHDLIAPGVELVVNCAAYTNVDGAETDEDEAVRVNGRAVALLAQRAAAVGAVLVHYSTDYVFAGVASEPYARDAARQPLNAYGRSKAAGERALAQSGAPFLCLRTSWLYAPWGNNFVLTMADLAATRRELKVVDDQRGRPSSCVQLADTTLAMLERGARGFHHATDAGECSWFELAKHVVARTHPETRVVPCTSAEFPRPAPRPAYSVLDISATEALVGPLQPWQQAVDAALDARER